LLFFWNSVTFTCTSQSFHGGGASKVVAVERGYVLL
jgi:hypothetical protein